MVETKPKVEGGARQQQRKRGQREYRKEHKSCVVGLENDTFDIGAAKYAAKFTKSLEALGD